MKVVLFQPSLFQRSNENIIDAAVMKLVEKKPTTKQQKTLTQISSSLSRRERENWESTPPAASTFILSSLASLSEN